MADSPDLPLHKVVVLGAGGFVGSHVVRALRDSVGFQPIAAFRRLPAKSRSSDVPVIVCDATDRQALARALQDADYVVNCVAGTGKKMIAASEAVCRAARRQPPRRIIHLSSMAIYGQAIGTVNEMTAPVPPSDDYGTAKQVCEKTMQAYVRDGGDAVILRPGCIHGPGSTQWTTRIARLLEAGRIGDLGPAGDGICNLTYIDDLIAAILSALNEPGLAGTVFNVVNRDVLTWNDYFIRFARALGATPVRRLSARRLWLESRLLAPPLVIAKRAGRFARLARHVPEPLTPSLVRLWQQDITLDSAQAAARLKMPQTPLDIALAASVHWLREVTITPAPTRDLRSNRTMELERR